MLKVYWEQILIHQDIRQNLSKIRRELKEVGNHVSFQYLLAGKEDVLAALLHSEDAKTRKNAALLMGDLGKQEFMEPLYDAYTLEKQKFVKSSYLAAMKNLDYRAYLEPLKERLRQLHHSEIAAEDEKHAMEEMRELSALIVMMEGVQQHRFQGWDETYDIILLTNRNFAELTESELLLADPGAKTKLFGAGVRARVTNLNWQKEIRTYQELLFVVKGMQTCSMNAAEAAKTIAESELIRFLDKGHKGKAPYYFRLEFKSKRPLDERSAFVKKLSGQLEKQSGRKLINSASNYEVEIRLIENKEGNCNLLVKLYTLKDERFAYRGEVMPTSIRPVNAALTAALTKDYLKPDAQVLDPFCGVGTMLIERHKAVRANTSYGLDIQEEAIEKGKINTQNAGQIIHYINRDFFRFTHDYLFDEIFTNMPFAIGRTTEDAVYELYEKFFAAIRNVLKEDAAIILYSHNREYIREMAGKNGYIVLEEFEVSKREGTYVVVLRQR